MSIELSGKLVQLSLSCMADYNSTMHKSVTYTKERPRRRDRHRPRTRLSPGAHPTRKFAPRAHSAHVTECARRENRCSRRVEGTHEHRSAHGMTAHLHSPAGAGADKVMPLDPCTEVTDTGITQCFRRRGYYTAQHGWRANGARDALFSHSS